MGDNAVDAEAKCPVDHKTRETWLAQARAAAATTGDGPGAATQQPAAATVTATTPRQDAGGLVAPNAPSTSMPDPSPNSKASSSWSSWSIPFFSRPQPPSEQHTPQQNQSQQIQRHGAPGGLGEDRQVSSIPRSGAPPGSGDADSASSSSCPANHEADTAPDAATGNWVYPSERMFFEAMRRKGFSAPRAADMRTVVPIHNAVNERAWAEIRRWEAPYCEAPSESSSTPRCAPGPRLHSFAGDSKRMSPRARLNTLLGYTAPFDRHDWVVDRCGTRVEYVIDFYAGKSGASAADAGGKLNFYLDVRPKLNSWEGAKMRFIRGLGLA